MRHPLAALLVAITLAGFGCGQSKPSEAQCRKAVEKIRKLTGLSRSDIGADPDAMVRSCRANSTKESVKCVIAAKNLDDLEKCEGAVGKKFTEEQKKREQEKKKKAAEGSD